MPDPATTIHLGNRVKFAGARVEVAFEALGKSWHHKNLPTEVPVLAKKRVQRRADSQLLRNIIKALHIGPVLYIQISI